MWNNATCLWYSNLWRHACLRQKVSNVSTSWMTQIQMLYLCVGGGGGRACVCDSVHPLAWSRACVCVGMKGWADTVPLHHNSGRIWFEAQVRELCSSLTYISDAPFFHKLIVSFCKTSVVKIVFAYLPPESDFTTQTHTRPHTHTSSEKEIQQFSSDSGPTEMLLSHYRKDLIYLKLLSAGCLLLLGG